MTPLRAEYELTELGRGLNKMLYEKLMWTIKFGLIDRNNPSEAKISKKHSE